VTKERVRQIQNKALAKIKAVMEEGVLRTKPEAKSILETSREAAD
jgi:RNA polymerase primary sigma factor